MSDPRPTPRPLRARYDAVVVGARVAGAATGLQLAARGHDVLVVDRAAEDSDTLSTHALMRPAVMQLGRWGVLDQVIAAGTPLITHTNFHYGSDVVPVEIAPDAYSDGLYAPRRSLLDSLLVAAARRAGATVRHKIRIVSLLRTSRGRVCGLVIDHAGTTREVLADIVIGADGMASDLASRVGAQVYRSGTTAGTCTVYAYVSDLDRHAYHWHFGRGETAGVIPTNDGLACVFVATHADRFQTDVRPDVGSAWKRLLHRVHPELAERVRAAGTMTRHRSFPGRRAHFRQSWGPGWALVGDAGHYDDPATAHGITSALRDAELLAEMLTNGDLPRYQRVRDELAEDVFVTTDRIAALDWTHAELAADHLALSRALRREAEIIAGWSTATTRTTATPRTKAA